MKTFLNLLTILGISVLVITSCKKKNDKKEEAAPQPVADFSYAISTSEPGKVVFTNQSQNYTFSSWDFGNGMSSNEASPTIIFTQGSYTVALTVNQGITIKKILQIENAYYLTAKGYTAHTVTGEKGGIGPSIRIATRRLTNDLGGYYDSDFNFDITFPKTATAGSTYTVSTIPNPLWFHYYYQTTVTSIGPTTANFQNGTLNGYLKVTDISATEVSGTFSCNLNWGSVNSSMTEGKFRAKLN